MTIENEAFIDIEQTLHNRTNAKWVKFWREIQGELNKLTNAGKWDEAHKLADTVDLDDLVDDSITLATTLAEAALFLGGVTHCRQSKRSRFLRQPRPNRDRPRGWAVVYGPTGERKRSFASSVAHCVGGP